MKVILTAEVKGKGHEGDVVEVARGYAVNYLMPRKMAITATVGNLKQLDARMSNIRKRNDTRLTEAQSLAASIEGKIVIIEGKAGDEGKLFGSVTTLMIEEAIAAQLGVDVDHRRMDLAKAIKMLGDHEVAVSVFGEVKATVTVRVVREGAGSEVAATVPAPEEPVAGDVVDETAAPNDAEPELEAAPDAEDAQPEDAAEDEGAPAE